MMNFKYFTLVVVSIVVWNQVRWCVGEKWWDEVHCAADSVQAVPDGIVEDIGRFPWLGVVQHSFYLGGKSRFAITTGVLIHPMYAIAPAEDISKILPQALGNNTKLILWQSSKVKYAIDVTDYILHPEFEERHTLATLALLQLTTYGETGLGENSNPALPACMPISGGGSYSDLYAVKMTDANKVLQKEMFKMSYVSDKECQEFYYNKELTYSKLAPAVSICARVERSPQPCLWDAGVALITRQDWGFWKIVGFSVRGPGCGAPARFLVVNDYMSWLTQMLEPEANAGLHRIGFRRVSPIKLIMYNADTDVNPNQGQCDRHERGGVLYKDSFEITLNKSFGKGFFFVVVTDAAEFFCAVVHMEDAGARSNAAVWVEHYCRRGLTGLAPGQKKPREYFKQECFIYYKSAAFVQFIFTFSFKTNIELTLFGKKEVIKRLPNPQRGHDITDNWWPTDTKIKWNSFVPYYLWYWHM